LKAEHPSSFSHPIFVKSLTVALGDTVADGPIGFMVAELQLVVMSGMAIQYAVLAHPLGLAGVTDVKRTRLGLVPIISETVNLLLKWNALL
jgi:hypothetical protein